MVYFGGNEIKGVYFGASAPKAAWFNGEQVWGGEEPATGDWLCFTSGQNGSTLRLDKVGDPGAISLETSVNEGASWKDYTWSGNTGTEFGNLAAGTKVYFRAKTENQTIGSSSSNYYKFVMSGQIAASGNIQTLLKADGSRTDAPAYCYYSMFQGCSYMTSAPTLPATTLAQYCYKSMFTQCWSLTTAPALPATTLAAYCYQQMFSVCTALTAAPALPATTLANYCYNNMFASCTSLTAAPTLPATTLADWCYGQMFAGCTSLTTAPALPATTLVTGCYSNMFSGCTSLTTAPTLPATTLAQYCYEHMFENCTSLATAPALPATTVVGYCYQYMFRSCSSLTAAPELPATSTLYAFGCYNSMFDGCTSLSSVEVAFSEWISNRTNAWLRNVAASGTFKCPAELPDTRGSGYIPNGWTVVKPEIKSLKFTATQANSTVSLSSLNGYQGTYLSSGDGVDFSQYAMNGVVSLDNVGDSVWFKAGGANQECTGDDNTGNWSGPRFVGTGRLSVDGWLESLTRADEADWYSYEKAYCALFRNNGAIEKVVARGEFLSASQGTGSSGSQQFRNTFRNCSALTSIEFPDILSATGGSQHTYSATAMFTNAFCLDDSLQVARFPKLEYARSDAFWAAFESDPALLSVEFPSLTGAGDDAFFAIFNNNVGSPKVVLLSAFESVPGLQANSGEGWKTLDSETSVVIPDALYDTWTTTSQWSNMAVTYVKASEFGVATA